MPNAKAFSISTLQDLSNDTKNTPMRGFLGPAVELWTFGSPGGLPIPNFSKCWASPPHLAKLGLRQGSSTDQVVSSLSHPFASDDCSTLNYDITLDEIVQMMRRLKCNKSASLDGIKAKFLQDVGDMLHLPLQIVFNKLLQQGYSASLSIGVIHALHKGDDALQFDNYMGITVGPVLAKVFAMILEARLSSWVEERGLRAKGQAGFRKDFRTTDNLYILRTLIEQNTHKRQKVYCCFVDFHKTFNTVPRDLLWQVLAEMGIVGRFMQCL